KDVINILLIGADTISGQYARSDTMILMSINNIKKRIVFTSFMRDTYVSIPGYYNNRLNAAFAAGGPSLLIKTIKLNFDIEIDHYFMVGISAFEQAVDIIGGFDITVNSVNYNYFKSFKQLQGLTQEQATDGTHVIHLNGGTALGYARSRNFYDGDFTRTLHQRDLLTQFASNCKGKSLTQLHGLLKAVLPYVVTNMPKETLKSMVWDVLTYISYDITDARVPCAGSFNFANIGGMEVLTINFPANERYVKAKIYG
ncbi:MAG: LCP family protein, partial [Clostridia bacterium]|nr:LCP family protein [Clostridia bacterium]